MEGILNALKVMPHFVPLKVLVQMLVSAYQGEYQKTNGGVVLDPVKSAQQMRLSSVAMRLITPSAPVYPKVHQTINGHAVTTLV